MISSLQTAIALLLAMALLALSPVAVTAVIASDPVRDRADGGEIMDVRFGVDARQRTRIVLDIDEEPHYRAFLKQDDTGTKRLVIEIDQAGFDIGGASSGAGEGIGHIGTYAFTRSDDDLARLIFDIEKTAVPQAVFLIRPKDGTSHHRLVIDMAGASEAAFGEQLAREHGPMRGGERLPQPAPGQTTQDAGPSLAQQGKPASDEDQEIAVAAAIQRARHAAVDHDTTRDLPVPRIKPGIVRRAPPPGDKAGQVVASQADANGIKAVANRDRKIIIDAGHGGKDPGAIGQGGTYEKTVTLAAAKSLQNVLLARGYDVVMTRAGDDYIDLEDRMPRRSKEAADLFVSIHADSIDNAAVRGASVYTLSSRGTLRLANQIDRNKRDGETMIGGVDLASIEGDLGTILADLSSDRAQEYSSLFADILIDSLDDHIAMVGNSHRQEDLKVLLAPDVPAVLLELGFMSNIHDEANLVREEWRNRTMETVADSIDVYFERHFTSRHVRLSEGAR